MRYARFGFRGLALSVGLFGCAAAILALRGWDAAVAPSTRLASAEGRRQVKRPAKLVAVLRHRKRLIGPLLFSPDGRLLLTGFSTPGRMGIRAETSGIMVWDGRTWKPKRMLRGTFTPGNFSRDGRRLSATTQEGYAQVWDVTAWKIIFHRSTRGAALSPDGTKLASVLDTPRFPYHLGVWDIPSGKLLRAYGYAHGSLIYGFSNDGKHVTSDYMDDSGTNVWNVATGELERFSEVFRHTEEYEQASFG